MSIHSRPIIELLLNKLPEFTLPLQAFVRKMISTVNLVPKKEIHLRICCEK